MKIAFITPIKLLRFVEEGDIGFSLTKFVLENKEYAKFYRKLNKYKINDNFAAEQGISMPAEQVLEAARKVKADECWASDKLFDRDVTLSLTKKFIECCKEKDLRRMKIAGIPQGKNLREWISCYKEMLKMQEIKVICLSKYSVVPSFKKLSRSTEISHCRIACLQYLLKHNLIDSKREYHIAGEDHLLLWEIKQLKRFPFVRSIDGNIPIKLALHDIAIDDFNTLKHTGEPKKRLDFFLQNITEEQEKLIKHNIKVVKEALR